LIETLDLVEAGIDSGYNYSLAWIFPNIGISTVRCPKLLFGFSFGIRIAGALVRVGDVVLVLDGQELTWTNN